MPKKGYKQTPEHVAKRAAALRGQRKTTTHRRNIQRSMFLTYALERGDVRAKE
jgi:hypothetical protein